MRSGLVVAGYGHDSRCPLLFQQPGAEQGAIDHAALAELYSGYDAFHSPGAGGAVGEAVALSPGFDGFHVLLWAD